MNPGLGTTATANAKALGLTIPDKLIALADHDKNDGIGIVTKVLYVEHNDDNICVS